MAVASLVTAAAVGPLSLLIAWPAAAAPPTPAAPPNLIAPPNLTASATLDRTSPLEARRVDRVKMAKIRWSTCTDTGGECAVIRLPLDYDEPNGPTTRIALGRVKAAKPNERIGTLFVNPGGPSLSASDFALDPGVYFDQQILDRFDIVGVDPRGVGRGDLVSCFKNSTEQQAAFRGLDERFPMTPAENRAHLRAARAHAKGCGTTGGPLAASMSTAQVARDMDVVRRALGEKELNFYGVSYGTQLGQVYANMFPDRVRTVVLDGVVNPVEWTTGSNGSGRTRPSDDRQRSADATYRAFRELMRRCDKAGAPACAFAGSGDSTKKFDVLAQRLKKAPLKVEGETVFTYAELVAYVASGLYRTDVGSELASFLQDNFTATDPAVARSRRDAAGRRAAAGISGLRASLRLNNPQVLGSQGAAAELPYNFGKDARISVICSDSVNPSSPNTWISTAKAADRRAPYFGSLWNWQSAACASSIWTARDEDRYLGPFTRRTVQPVLIVSNYYDPVTSYRDGAVAVSKLLPNSRLLSSNGWGHYAYANNTCVSEAAAAYLMRGTLPAKGAVCTGPQPFEKTAAPAVSSTVSAPALGR